MIVLTINAGSSSVRLDAYSLEETAGRTALASFHGAVPPAKAHEFLEEFCGPFRHREIAAIAHRIVHGGADLTSPTLLEPEVEEQIERLSSLAPLHIPASLNWIRACRKVLPNVLQVAVFDTGFYASMPVVARTYALPRQLAASYHIRRYGFHGLAHEAMWRRWREFHPERRHDGRVISLQLGGGCSVTATRGGVAVDTSMGFTPLEGLVMATRVGDVDPGILLYLQRELRWTNTEIERVLSEQSGLLGISAVSGDMRVLLASAEEGARTAIEVYSYRARKYIGSYLAVLGGADAVLFGGGVGENAPSIRAKILAGMDWAGIVLDPSRNDGVIGREAPIHAPESRVEVWVVPVHEASLLVEAAVAVLRRTRETSEDHGR